MAKYLTFKVTDGDHEQKCYVKQPAHDHKLSNKASKDIREWAANEWGTPVQHVRITSYQSNQNAPGDGYLLFGPK